MDTSMPLQTMTPEHQRWAEFCERLAGPEGCDFTEDGKWKCHGGTDKRFATAILTDMGGVDIPATLRFFEENGGYCDCEILFNVDE